MDEVRKEDRERQDMMVRGLTEMMTFEPGLERSEDIYNPWHYLGQHSVRKTDNKSRSPEVKACLVRVRNSLVASGIWMSEVESGRWGPRSRSCRGFTQRGMESRVLSRREMWSDSVLRGLLVVVKELTVRSWGMITQVRDAGDLGQGVPLRVGGGSGDLMRYAHLI